jgi:hypothetical protein
VPNFIWNQLSDLHKFCTFLFAIVCGLVFIGIHAFFEFAIYSCMKVLLQFWLNSGNICPTYAAISFLYIMVLLLARKILICREVLHNILEDVNIQKKHHPHPQADPNP